MTKSAMCCVTPHFRNLRKLPATCGVRATSKFDLGVVYPYKTQGKSGTFVQRRFDHVPAFASSWSRDSTMSWRRFDLNVKGVDGIQERTIGGGVVTLLSCALVALDVSDSKGHKEILLKQDIQEEPFGENGCRLFGTVQVQKVAGDLSFAHEGSLTVFSFFDFLNFNSSHVVNHLRFGPQIPDMETPLIDVSKILTRNCTLLLHFEEKIAVPYFTHLTYCVVSSGDVQHETSSRGANGQVSFPGVTFSYEFSPIAVEYIESKPSVLHFLTSTSAIVGGVFAVARMIDGAIYSVSKKID
ncbi:unnamed protein product [Phytophthora fragariaefolia]|uniref:Unnamed protein product n=1 Tax=Phytophthora fragariaefolia TaxID=1490495 RepID=A0A9W6WUF9_9STRA|nr:unnamed protein product [Phytophthora fragariaefolia]